MSLDEGHGPQDCASRSVAKRCAVGLSILSVLHAAVCRLVGYVGLGLCVSTVSIMLRRCAWPVEANCCGPGKRTCNMGNLPHNGRAIRQQIHKSQSSPKKMGKDKTSRNCQSASGEVINCFISRRKPKQEDEPRQA